MANAQNVGPCDTLHNRNHDASWRCVLILALPDVAGKTFVNTSPILNTTVNAPERFMSGDQSHRRDAYRGRKKLLFFYDFLLVNFICSLLGLGRFFWIVRLHLPFKLVGFLFLVAFFSLAMFILDNWALTHPILEGEK
jgi:hypothetical protein